MSNGDLIASLPYDSAVEYAVDAGLLGKAVRAVKDADIVFDGDGLAVTFTKGTRTVKVEAIPPITWAKIGIFEEGVTPVWKTIDGDFVDSVLALSEVMSDDASREWAMAVTLHEKKLIATDGSTLFFKACDHEGTVSFPKSLINFVKTTDKHAAVNAYAVGHNWVAFKYDTGLIVGTKRYEDERPDGLANVIRNWVEPTLIVSQELRDAVESACEIAEHIVELEPHRVSARVDGASFEELISTGVSEGEVVTLDKTRVKGLILKAVKVKWQPTVSLFILEDGTNAMQARRG